MEKENNILTKKSNIIGICVSQLQDKEIAGLMHTIVRHVVAKGYKAMIFGGFAKHDFPTAHTIGEASIYENIPMEELAALILMGQTILHRELLEDLRDQALAVNTPVITVDYEMEHCFNIRLDYLSCFKRLVHHVIEGHHCLNPYFMAGFRGNSFSEERLNVFKEVLQENGMPVVQEHIEYGDFWSEPARRICEKWMEKTDDLPDAIICANDTMALTVINVLEEHGYRIPDDIIVSGFDGIELINYCTPLLTTGRVDQEEIARQIVLILDKVEADPDTVPRPITVPFHIMGGESCGCNPVKRRTSNQYVLDVYTRMDQKQIHMDHIFQMMTEFTEGHSMMGVLKQFDKSLPDISTGDCLVFVNKEFCNHTDIPISRQFKEEHLLLILQKKRNKYTVPLLEVEKHYINTILQELWGENRQILLLPMHWQSEVYGYVALENGHRVVDYERLKDFMMTFSQIMGTVRNQSQLYEMYIRDALTGLYNRRGFYGELEQRMKELEGEDRKIFLASVDLDHLKMINDNYGHSEGDVAIKAVADALLAAVGEKGICARFGGDEYVAICLWGNEDVPKHFVRMFHHRLQEWIDRWNEREKKQYSLGASTGVILEQIHDTGEIDELMKRADDNMYDCKERHHSIRSSRRK
ncbi:MAG: GGDEF domain-containing protein [Lachnospiraceae bacterium]|nr:GGDEF domain-containing protein [Lachnospiraceae bacterium]